MWANVWAGTSAFFTAVTAGIALLALLRWRKQEELKVKLEFKQAIGRYSFALVKMPADLSPGDLLKYRSERENLSVLFHACMQAWEMTEGLLDKNKYIHESWKSCNEAHHDYVSGRSSSYLIDKLCSQIMQYHFVFK